MTPTTNTAASPAPKRLACCLAGLALAVALGACSTVKPAMGPGSFGSLGKIQPMAEQGHAGSQNLLGVMYFKGDEVARNYDAAIRWWTAAAAQGDPDAQYNLGYLYADPDNRAANIVLAHMWLTIAADNGDTGAAQYRAELQRQMTPRQIREAGVMADTWLDQADL